MTGLNRVWKSNQIEPKKLCESVIGFEFRTQSNLIKQCRNHFINQTIGFD